MSNHGRTSTILELLEKIRGEEGTLRARTEDADHLRGLVNKMDFSAVSEKSLQQILATLYSIIRAEVKTMLRAKEASLGSYSLRISSYGHSVRIIISKSLGSMKMRTLKVYLNHMMDVLPASATVLLKALAATYLRLLQTILEHPAHLNHFDHVLWLDCVRFCINAIQNYESLTSAVPDPESAPSDYTRNNSLASSEVVSLFSCLNILLSWPAAIYEPSACQQYPLVDSLAGMVMAFFESRERESNAHTPAAGVLVALLAFTCVNRVDLACTLADIAVTTAITHWNTRTVQFKQNLLSCLILCTPLLPHLSRETTASTSLQKLIARMVTESTTRLARNDLLLSDLSLCKSDLFTNDSTINLEMRTTSFTLSSVEESKEFAFMSVQVMAGIYAVCTDCLERLDVVVPQNSEDGPARKRRKLEEGSEFVPLEGLLSDQNVRIQLVGLQIFTFVCESQLETFLRKSVVDKVRALLLSESNAIQNWSRLGLAAVIRLAGRPCFRSRRLSEIDDDFVQSLWVSTLRSIASPATSRSACHLGISLLESDIISPQIIALHAFQVVRSVDTMGPVFCTEAACEFVSQILQLLKAYNYISADEVNETAIHWLQRRLQTLTVSDLLSSYHDSIVAFSLKFVGMDVINREALRSVITNDSSPGLVAASRSNIDTRTRLASAGISLLEINEIADLPHEVFPENVSEHRRSKKRRSALLDNLLIAVETRSKTLSATFLELPSSITLLWEGISLVMYYFQIILLSTRTTVHPAIQRLCEELDTYLSGCEVNHVSSIAICRILRMSTYSVAKRSRTSQQLTFCQTFRALWESLIHALETDVAAGRSFQNSFGDLDEAFSHDTKNHADNSVSCAPRQVRSSADVVFLCSILLDLSGESSSLNDLAETHFEKHFLQERSTALVSCSAIWSFWEILQKNRLSVRPKAVSKFLVESILPAYQHERDEGTFHFVVKFLSVTLKQWAAAAPGDEDLLGQKMYDWLIKVSIVARLASHFVRLAIVTLCESILRINMSHGTNDNIGKELSTRSILVNRLTDDDLRVAVHAGKSSLVIFDHHESHVHDKIFDDIVQALPSDSSRTERLKLRCYVLSLLASTVEVSRMQAIHYLLELIQFPDLISCLTTTFKQISRTLSTDPRGLLESNKTSILWSWLQASSFSSFPHHLFGFQSLLEFTNVHKKELVAQLVSQGCLDQFEELCSLLKVDERVLLEKYVVKIRVYSLIRQLEGQSYNSSNFLKSILGSAYVGDGPSHLSIVCWMFPRIHDCGDGVRLLSKLGHNQASACLDVLLKTITSEYRSPAREPLQCSLKGFMKAFTSLHPSTKFSKPSAIKIARILSGDLRSDQHVHRAQALRKLALLLAMTDNIFYSGYSFQVLLRILSAVLLQHSSGFESDVCSLLSRLLSSAGDQDAESSNAVFCTTVLLLHARRTSSLTQITIDAIRAYISPSSTIRAGVKNDSMDWSMFLDAPARGEECSIARFRRAIQKAHKVFNSSNSSYTSQIKRRFVYLVAEVCKTEFLRIPEIVEDLRLLVGVAHSPLCHTDAALVSRLLGSRYLMGEYSPEVCREKETFPISFSGYDKRTVTRYLLDSLESFDFTITEHAEVTISQMVGTVESDWIPKAVADCLDDRTIVGSLQDQSATAYDLIRSSTYSEWFKSLLILLFEPCKRSEDDFLLRLAHNVSLDRVLADRLLLHLVDYGMRGGQAEFHKRLFDLIQRSFAGFMSAASDEIRICLLILQGLRALGPIYADLPLDEPRSMKIDYISAARAALHHLYYVDALLCLEIASLMPSSLPPEISRSLQLKIYQEIDEPDSFYGVEQDASLRTALNLAEYESEGQRTLPIYSAFLAAERRTGVGDNSNLANKIGSSFRSLGMDVFNLSSQDGSAVLDEPKYESSWRLEQWNLPFTSTAIGAHQHLYRTLSEVATLDLSDPKTALERLSSTFVDLLKIPGNASSRVIAISVLLEFEELLLSFKDAAAPNIYDLWHKRSEILSKKLQFEEFEVILAARQVFLDLGRKQYVDDSKARTSQLRLLVQDYSHAVTAHDYQTALAATVLAQTLSEKPGYGPPTDVQVGVKSLAADVLWLASDRVSSIRLLQSAIQVTEVRGEVNPLSAANNLLNLGLRCSIGRFEKPGEILKRYLAPAIDILANVDRTVTTGKSFLKFAFFCDEQLENLKTSEDFRRLGRLRNEKLRELADLDHLIMQSKGSEQKRRLQAQRAKAQALFDSDNSEYLFISSSQEVYLSNSIESFLRAFSCTDEGDTLISRCTSLWFANSTNAISNTAFAKNIEAVPSYKFLVLLNQLLARLSTASDAFQDNLSRLLYRLASDHPYHALYTMYAVQYSKRSGDEAAKSRVKSIAKIVQDLSANRSLGDLIANVRTLCANYVKLATTPIDKSDFPNKNIPFSAMTNSKMFLHEFARLRLPPLTLQITPRLSCDYSDVPVIETYEKTFRLAGGISVPKILQCRTNDGNVCKELVKGGNDDLRQDVVMQQVFSQVESMFRKNRSTQQRKLRIRTYKVLPLATNAGVLEWVSRTVPMQEFLEKLHKKYYPDDWPYQKCRSTIAEVAKRSRTTRIEVYKKVTEKCRPAMKHAFLDMFHDAQSWHAAQLAYTRSTAAMSIVGYVLGLGDRHLHNIILDTSNGEVVHIDLGIAFEQGKTLPIPELVPFRLTRDVVDGMGMLKTEGVFRRCCEFTLDVMRKERSGISSILDVLRHDPLYSWTLSPVQKLRMQEKDRDGDPDSAASGRGDKDGGPEMGTEAARALLVVERKLSSTLSVSAVVSELIQEATDPENLALIFAGWAAWY